MGDPLQDMQVVYQTGTGMSTFRTDSCTNCPLFSTRFQIDDSTSFDYVEPTTYDTVRY